MIRIAKPEYARRRKALMAQMEPNSIAILPAAPMYIRNRDVEHVYRQDRMAMLLGSICAISALRRRAYSGLAIRIMQLPQCREGLSAGAGTLPNSENSSSGATRRYSWTSM